MSAKLFAAAVVIGDIVLFIVIADNGGDVFVKQQCCCLSSGHVVIFLRRPFCRLIVVEAFFKFKFILIFDFDVFSSSLVEIDDI